MYRFASHGDGATRLRRRRPRMVPLVMLLLIGNNLCAGRAQSRAASLELKPKETRTLPIWLADNQIARVDLHLEGGILGVSAVAPDGKQRPLWLIDLGRGAGLTYIVGGAAAGDYSFTVTSFEKQRAAKVSVTVEPAERPDQASLSLRDAEDDLANAELVRRHWPSAAPGLNAASTFDKAFDEASRLDDLPLQRLILTQKARLWIFGQSRFADARTLLEQAVAIPSAGDAAEQALAWKTLSTARYDLGDYRGAIQASHSALDLYRQTGDRYWQGIVLGNLSSVYAELGRRVDALSAAQEALEDAREEYDPAGLVYSLSELANLHLEHGDLEDAFRTYYEGLSWVKDIRYAPLIEAEIQKDFGLFCIQIGDWDRARQALRRSLEIDGSNQDPNSLEAHGAVATVLQHDGKLNLAVKEDSEAIETARFLKLKQDEAELLLKRAAIQLQGKHRAEGEEDIQAASRLATELAAIPLQAEAQIAWGNARLATDEKGAEASYRKAMELADYTGDREQKSDALAGLASAQQQQGQLEDALVSAEHALQILEASRLGLSSHTSQASYVSIHRDWYELAVELCMQLEKMHPSHRYAERAFAYAERARARSLLDALNSSGYSAVDQVPEQLRERYARNRQAILSEESSLSHDDVHASDKHAETLQALYGERDGLESQIAFSDDRMSSLLGSQTAEIKQIQDELLSDDSVLLSYWAGKKQSYRWLITAHSISVKILPPRSEIERTIVPLERSLQNRRPRVELGDTVATYAVKQDAYELRVRDSLARSGSLLLSGLPSDTRRIVVVGDGCLMSLPFAALRLSDGSSVSYAIRKYSFESEPSASVALYLKRHAMANQGRQIAIFADPVLSRDDARIAAPASRTGHLGRRPLFAELPRLTGSMKEARAIARLGHGESILVKSGFDANLEQVRGLSSSNVFVLHFATHTVNISGHPELSGIALSMFAHDGKERDGILWLKDIESLRLPLSMVVLSGCETDQEAGDSGEAVNSLAYAFFLSGVHSVVASLWKVDDRTTSELMENFYRKLLTRHLRTDDALRAAQLEMLSHPQTSFPAIWGSFVSEGSPVAYTPDTVVLSKHGVQLDAMETLTDKSIAHATR